MYILNDLWYGNITPSERYIRSGSEYQTLSDELSVKLTAFVKELSHDSREQYEIIEKLRAKLNFISEGDSFILGFRLGARMILDVIGEYDGQFEYPVDI